MSGNIVGNRYEIIEQIGSGGMAIVYKARCRLLNRYVAVKILRSEFNNDMDFLKRFETEAQAAASLSHPNIVSVYDVGSHNNMRYIVMEYVDGETLKEYLINNAPLSTEKILDFSMQIASALEHAHSKKIIHHDIKPHNIIITEEGLLKVTDFGLARAVSSTTTIASDGAVGSVHYVSPEQARGGFTDEKSDIYSLGVTMYEMMTGKVPFDGETPVAVAMKHLQKEPVLPSAIVPEVSPAMEKIVLKALVKDVAGRYQSASEMISDLYGVYDNNPDMKKTSSDVTRFTRKLPSMDEIEEEKKRIEIEHELEKQKEREREIERKKELQKKKEELEQLEKENNEENKKEKSKAKKKKEDSIAVVAGIATTVVIVIILFLMMNNFFGIKPEPKDTKVPDFVNMTYEDAEKLAKEYSLPIEIEGYEYSNKIDENVIISQEPEEGEEITEETIIKVIVSRGPDSIVLDDYRNKNPEDVKKALDSLKIKYEEAEIHDNEVKKGKVAKTEPGAKSKIGPDTVVTIYVSLGEEKKETVAPSIIGNQLEDAKILLKNRRLDIGEISYIDSEQPKDTVVQQFPVPGADVEDGTKVNVVLSRGSKNQTPQQTQQPQQTPQETQKPDSQEQTQPSTQPPMSTTPEPTQSPENNPSSSEGNQSEGAESAPSGNGEF